MPINFTHKWFCHITTFICCEDEWVRHLREAFHFCGGNGRKALLWQIAHEVHQEKIYIFFLKRKCTTGKNTKNHKSFPTFKWERKFSFALHTLHNLWWMNWKKHFKVFFIVIVNEKWMIYFFQGWEGVEKNINMYYEQLTNSLKNIIIMLN